MNTTKHDDYQSIPLAPSLILESMGKTISFYISFNLNLVWQDMKFRLCAIVKVITFWPVSKRLKLKTNQK